MNDEERIWWISVLTSVGGHTEWRLRTEDTEPDAIVEVTRLVLPDEVSCLFRLDDSLVRQHIWDID